MFEEVIFSFEGKLWINGSLTPNNLLLTGRSDCKNLGAEPIASNGLKPVWLDILEQMYLKNIWREWSLSENFAY